MTRAQGTFHPGRFRPGQSANPGGRPAGIGKVRDLARAYTAEAVAKLVEKMRGGKSDTIQVNAAIELLVWGYGRPGPQEWPADGQHAVLISWHQNWREITSPDMDPQEVLRRASEAELEGQRQNPPLKALPGPVANGLLPSDGEKATVPDSKAGGGKRADTVTNAGWRVV
jgi:hypothetical protein